MVNKVILVGRLTKDPEKRLVGESDLSSFSVATSYTWKDKNGDKQEKSEFHNCTAWNKLAGICNQYLTKGQLVYIEGRLQTDKYEKDGVMRYATKVIVDQLKMIGGKPQKPGEGAPQTQATTTAPPVQSDMEAPITIEDIPF